MFLRKPANGWHFWVSISQQKTKHQEKIKSTGLALCWQHLKGTSVSSDTDYLLKLGIICCKLKVWPCIRHYSTQAHMLPELFVITAVRPGPTSAKPHGSSQRKSLFLPNQTPTKDSIALKEVVGTPSDSNYLVISFTKTEGVWLKHKPAPEQFAVTTPDAG